MARLTLAAAALVAASAAAKTRLERDLEERDVRRNNPFMDAIYREMESSPTATAMTWVPLSLDTGAACLDGSPYMVAICKSTVSNANWTIGIQGGGWCYSEEDCLGRASTPLGSSSTWPKETYPCNPQGTQNVVQLNYGDGASFSGFRQDPWPVPGANSSLMFRGIRNLDATLDLLFANYGLGSAELVILSGGSAGGLSTFLHLDHVAERVREHAPNARVVGQPVCGFFLDLNTNDGNNMPNVTYGAELRYVYQMQNTSGALSKECQAANAADPAMCIFAPHAVPFIETPWFALQSRFDHWQLSEEVFIPCILDQPYSPPYKPSSCNSTEVAQIQAYGPTFMSQFTPAFLPTASRNGVFLDACIIHGSTNSSINGLTNGEAFATWLAGGPGTYIALCDGSNSTGPCDPSPICAPF
jgi:hypothetical protein